ncbi:MAG: integration host factor subunit beta [Bacteroidales bacterium]|nr:integration host factor subunit beta [Bacteroidales bacterium]
MTKAEIVNEIAKEKGLDKAEVQAVIEEFMKCVKNALADDKPVYLRGFGSFITKKRAQKAARNITQKTTITIEAHKIPAFKPAKEFAAEVKKIKID